MLVILAVIASLSMSFSFRIIPITPNLDPSFVYSFNDAAARGLKWGREFISTYGPYGYLISTMDLGHLLRGKILFGLSLAVGIGIAVAAYLRSVPDLGPGMQVAIMLAVIYAFSIQMPDYQWFALFVLVYLAGVLTPGRAGLVAYALAGLLAGFFGLIKLSLGLGAAMTLAAGCLLTTRPWRVAHRALLIVLTVPAGFLIFWIAFGGALDGIGSYLTTGWEVSAGYSSGLSLALEGWWVEVAGFALWFVLLACWVLGQPTPRNRLVLLGLLVPLFVAWKHSIVRQDEHVTILARFAIFVTAVLLAETVSVSSRRAALTAVVVVLVPLALPWTTAASRPFYAVTTSDMVISPVAFRGLKALVRLAHLADYRARVAHASGSALRANVLPESIRTVIGRARVDVYPWDTSYVPANRLDWDNRPFAASFNVYTPVLDACNAAFFESGKRPEYLIWHAGFASGERSVDGRYILWDEPRTMRAIVNHYEVTAADSNVILLRVRARPRFGPPRQLGTLTSAWNAWIPVPQTDGVLSVSVSMDRSLILRGVRTVFRDEPVFASVAFSPGEVATYRVVTDNMESGLWLSPFAASFPELLSLLRDGTGRRVTAIRFNASPLVTTFAPSLRMSWFDVTRLDGQ